MQTRFRPRRARRLFSQSIESLESRELLANNVVISGFVFLDANHDGLFQPTESPLGGSTVELINSKGVVVGTTTAAADGSYSFNTDQTVPTTPQTLTETITVPVTSTPFTNTQSVPQFDPSLGTLTSVDVTNNATVTDTIMVENTDTAPHTLTGIVNGTVTASGPGVSSLVVTTTDSVSFDATAFDGKIDFGGTSGHNFGPRPVSDTVSQTLTSQADLSLYTGTGTVSFTDQAVANAKVTGSGNVVQSVATVASGSIVIVYH